MSKQGSSHTKAAAAHLTAVPGGILQLKCACGNRSVAAGECRACGKDSLQRKPNGQTAMGAGLSMSRGSVMQTKLAIGASDDPLEREAERVADQVLAWPTHPVVKGVAQRIQRFAWQPVAQAATAPESVDRVLAGSGRPLDTALRQDLESRFSHDFSRVRVHSDPMAEQSAREMNARAYTLNNNIVFGRGEFAPDTQSGRKLLAHELAHVVQQQEGGEGKLIQRKVNAVRFQDEPTLLDISEGKKVLKEKDHGEAVVRVTIALHELGHYTIDAIDESFDPPLTSAVTKYQTAKGITGKALAGSVDKPTLTELDADFSANFKVERDTLTAQKSPDLLKHTQMLDDEERAAGARAISTEARVNPVTGSLPTFVPEITGKGKYEKRLTKAVDDQIVAEFNMYGKDKAAAHADAGKLFGWPLIEAIALESQKAVDGRFGEYTKGRSAPPAALKQGVNIKDAWDDKVAQLSAGGKPAVDASARWRVEKIITGDETVAALDVEHGAIQSRPAEAAIVARVALAMFTKYRTELIETHKGWPGYADGGKIFIQRFKETDNEKNRWSMWDFYQTFIHEYIHTLESAAYKTYRGSMAEQKGGFTLREGTTDYFTKIVWSGIAIDDALRKKIEGAFHDPVKKFKIQELNTYPQSKNAERLAGIVGLRNLAAAFFLGKVEFIGKK